MCSLSLLFILKQCLDDSTAHDAVCTSCMSTPALDGAVQRTCPASAAIWLCLVGPGGMDRAMLPGYSAWADEAAISEVRGSAIHDRLYLWALLPTSVCCQQLLAMKYANWMQMDRHNDIMPVKAFFSSKHLAHTGMSSENTFFSKCVLFANVWLPAVDR